VLCDAKMIDEIVFHTNLPALNDMAEATWAADAC
jgi:hypothetical protein